MHAAWLSYIYCTTKLCATHLQTTGYISYRPQGIYPTDHRVYTQYSCMYVEHVINLLLKQKEVHEVV